MTDNPTINTESDEILISINGDVISAIYFNTKINGEPTNDGKVVIFGEKFIDEVLTPLIKKEQ